MSFPWALALWTVIQAAPPADPRKEAREKEVLGRWTHEATTLSLTAGGTGSLEGDGDFPATLTWTLEPTGVLHLSFEGAEVKCLFTRLRDRVWCRGDRGPLFPRGLAKEGWKPKPPPTARPCTLKVIEGTSAGPLRLGMKRREVEKLNLPFKFARDPRSPEWLAGGPYRVRFDAAGAAVQIIANASEDVVLCLEPGPTGADCGGPPNLLSGGDFMDCPARGVRARKNFLGVTEDIEIFPPVSARTAALGPDECTIWVKPGKALGPFRLGMSRRAAGELGLGLQAFDPSGRSLTAGPYLVTFDPGTDTIAAIRTGIAQLGATDRACLDSGPVSADWKREELCAHGFCRCSIERDALAQGIAHARCPEGIRFDFDFGSPGRLFMVEVTAPAK